MLAERREKLERLREDGVEPFPHEFAGRERDRRRCAPPTRGSSAGEETERAYRVAGRIAARRGHGKAAFLDLVDGSGQIQLHARARRARRGGLRARCVDLDLGDIVGVDGTAFETRARRALAARSTGWTLLAKSLRPPPDKFHGLEDTETALPPPRARPDRQRRRAASCSASAAATIAAIRELARRARASSRSRRRSCSRSTAARWRGRSPPTTTRSTATSTCGSRPSST